MFIYECINFSFIQFFYAFILILIFIYFLLI
jgi:hypothetical protein